MFELITKIGSEVVLNLVQMIIGTLLAIVIYVCIHKKLEKSEKDRGRDLILILSSSSVGALLPLETYGVLPIVLVLLQMGVREYVVLPLLFSNTLFNLLIPFNDPSFVWRSGYSRLLLAIVLGMIAGLIIKVINSKKEVFQLNKLTVQLESPIHVKSIFRNIHSNVTVMGAYLIIGVVLNVLFNEFVLYNVTDAFFSHPGTVGITRVFSRFNIVHPLFLLGVSMIYMLMNFIKLSGLLFIIQPKGVAMYLVFCGICAGLLSCSIFSG